MTCLEYKTHMCLYYNMKCFKGDISPKANYWKYKGDVE